MNLLVNKKYGNLIIYIVNDGKIKRKKMIKS